MNQDLINALNQTIKAQAELINYLKAEVERLKVPRFPSVDLVGPGPQTGQAPYPPYHQPFIGGGTITVPGTHNPPFTLTGDVVSPSKNTQISPPKAYPADITFTSSDASLG